MLVISLYRYPHHKLSKLLCLSYYLVCFLFNKTGEQESGTCSAQKPGVGEGAEAMYTHVSKCKNGKIKENMKK
jgi:hypothetical protein